MLPLDLSRGLALTPLAIAFSALGVNAFAANPTELAPVVVTATRTAQTVDESLSAVTVITREDLARTQATSLGEVFRRVPGVSVTNQGGAGKLTDARFRGMEADHVLYLVDGVRIGAATAGVTAIQDLPIESIERIEVVRGPRSSLYGPDAVGGVVQIFTRKRSGDVLPHGAMTFGSHDTVKGNIGVDGSVNDVRFAVNLNMHEASGFNACAGSVSAGCFTVEPDDDGYSHRSVQARAGTRLPGGGDLALTSLMVYAQNEYDGSFVNESTVRQYVFGATLRQPVNDLWDMSFSASRSTDETDNYLNGVFKTRFATARQSFGWQNDIAAGESSLFTVGVDYTDDHVDSTTAYAVDSRYDAGVFMQWQGQWEAFDVQLALRHDDNEQFGGYDTGNVALGVPLGGELRLTGSVGTAFKAPNFNELYWPADAFYRGNPNLQPEESRTVEVGLSGSSGVVGWAMNAFQTEVDNLIGTYTLTLPNYPANLSKARINGIEAQVDTRLGAWSAAANLTLMETKNLESGANNGNWLNRRPQQVFNLDLDRSFGRYRVGGTLHAEGKRYDNLANTTVLAGYATVDLRSEVELDRAWRLQARVVNLFNEKYETASLFNQEGQSVYLTLRYQP